MVEMLTHSLYLLDVFSFYRMSRDLKVVARELGIGQPHDSIFVVELSIPVSYLLCFIWLNSDAFIRVSI